MNDIVFDKEYTYAYRDIYNEQCDCQQCVLFRNQFPNKYQEVIKFLSQYGVNVDFPLEIMDIGIDDKTLKRGYIVYYAVKGQLPKEKMSTNIGNVGITMRNDIVADEAYANTGMQAPFFIIELSNIALYDNENVFREAVTKGREIEFSYNGQHFFESHNSDVDWYIYHEETRQTQSFKSANDLLSNAILQSCNINEIWNQIIIDYLL